MTIKLAVARIYDLLLLSRSAGFLILMADIRFEHTPFLMER